MSFSLTEDQRAQLQPEIQIELEKREWAEPEDNVMAEYISVLLANGNAREKVHSEMDDYFDSSFLDWLFSAASSIVRLSSSDPSPAPVISAPTGPSSSSSNAQVSSSSASRSPVEPRSRRLLDTALAPLSGQGRDEGNKRKMENHDDGRNRKRLSDGIPGGPRAMTADARGLADRLGARGQTRTGMQVRGAAGPGAGPSAGGSGLRNNGVNGMGNRGGGMGMGMGMNQGMGQGQMGGFQNGFQPGMMQPGFGQFFNPNPGQQEMMAQMMMMQANMAQMGEMMQKMAEEKEDVQMQSLFGAPAVRPVRPPPVKVPHGTKLGSHSVSVIKPKTSSTPGPIPDKPSSTALCRYSIGCSNARCTFSHPSPAADEKTGMVLSEEPCENGKKCKDAECIKSHVSPAAVLAGPSRLLCKYQNCTNTACPFRHEDAEGNPIPPPALAAAKAAKDKATSKAAAAEAAAAVAGTAGSDNEDGDVEVVMSSKGLMDGALDDSRKDMPCRYGERCTRPDCKFTHPPSRALPKNKAKFGKSFAPSPRNGGIGGMNMSKKFGSSATGTTAATATTASSTQPKLDPAAGEFKPKAEGGQIATAS